MSHPHGTAARTSIPNRWPQWSGRSLRPIPPSPSSTWPMCCERIESVVDQITFVVRLLAGFSILAGLTILASSIASTRFRRMQEAVVLKTLGATRMRIVRTFSVEFAFWGCWQARSASSSPTCSRACFCTGSTWPFKLNGAPRSWRSSERRCWPRPQAGSQATGFSACARLKCCAKNERIKQVSKSASRSHRRECALKRAKCVFW